MRNACVASMTEIGEQVAIARLAHRWSQRELGRRAGCDQGTISKIEHGRGCSLGQLRAVAQALGGDVRIIWVKWVREDGEVAVGLRTKVDLPGVVERVEVAAHVETEQDATEGRR